MSISDERIISALVNCGTVTAAADSLQCSRKTISRRLQDVDFCAMYAAARDDTVKATTAELSAHMQAAARTLATIMQNEEEAAPIRIRCAELILKYGCQLKTLSDLVHRFEEIDEAAKNSQNRDIKRHFTKGE